jgi:repressor LexA
LRFVLDYHTFVWYLYFMRELSVKQREILQFIRDSIGSSSRAPTIREIAAHFGFSSTGTVRDYLAALSRKGYLKLNRHKARAIELNRQLFSIPVLGRVAAGSPQLAVEDIEGYIDPGEFDNPGGDLFALRVKGDSMREAGILEGDIVVVRRQAKAAHGDIVVALLGEEATVKVFTVRGRKFFLCPRNSRYKDIPCTDSTKIIGKVISVIRRYV